MTDDLTGRIAAVNSVPLGGMLAADAPVGSTQLVVEDAADFDAAGGSLVVRGGNPATDVVEETVAYTAADDDTGIVTLAAPLANAFYTDDRVDLWDPATSTQIVETVAQVTLVGDEQNADTVEAIVDHALIPYLPEGIRTDEAAEAVSLGWRGQTLYVLNVIGRVPVMDGGMIDPDTLPPSGAEPETPDTPAAPTVYGGIGSLLIRWGAILHPNPVVYEVHVSATPGFTPGPTTFVGEVSGTALTVRRLPIPDEFGAPDSALLYGVTYSVALIAKDSVDETFTSGKSAEGLGSPVQATGGDIAPSSVTTEHLTARSVAAENLSAELTLSSLIKTADTGQRVEFDVGGVRLHGPDDDVRINLPTDPNVDPSFRGSIQADGLTVRQGATFYSPINEFARDSRIALAEQVSGPVAAPTPEFVYDRFALQRTAYDGPLGNFSLNPDQITAVGRDDQTNEILVLQRRTGGTRLWHYTMVGALSALWGSTPFQDFEDLDVTGVWRKAGGYEVVLARWNSGTTTKWLYWDEQFGTSYRDYDSGYLSTNAMLTYDGTNMVIAETMGTTGNTRWRIIANAGGTISYTTVTSSGITALGTQPVFAFRGAADLGATKHMISYADAFQYRVFDSAGVYQADRAWQPPVTKAGGFWHPTSGRFFTVGRDGYLYTHSALTWTDPTLDTWHVAQSFLDTNATGGTHETNLGAITTFTMRKRASVRFSLADVPYSGEVDDPNAWAIYAKRGAAPATNFSDMKRQSQGSYTVKTFVMSTAPTTSGSSALQFGTFPGGTPARMVSQRAMPGDATKPVFEARGDGSGRWGGLEVDGSGVWTWGAGPAALTITSGYTGGNANAAIDFGGKHVVLSGTITINSGNLARGVTIATIPDGLGLRPPQTRRVIATVGNGTPGSTSGQSGTTAVTIFSSGGIQLNAADNALSPHTIVYLDAIRFPL